MQELVYILICISVLPWIVINCFRLDVVVELNWQNILMILVSSAFLLGIGRGRETLELVGIWRLFMLAIVSILTITLVNGQVFGNVKDKGVLLRFTPYLVAVVNLIMILTIIANGGIDS